MVEQALLGLCRIPQPVRQEASEMKYDAPRQGDATGRRSERARDCSPSIRQCCRCSRSGA
jgi:hypothetical protein